MVFDFVFLRWLFYFWYGVYVLDRKNDKEKRIKGVMLVEFVLFKGFVRCFISWFLLIFVVRSMLFSFFLF